MSKKVYIIILNYNGWTDTIECLESVLRNDYSNYQVIVVDNNSPNNSMVYIKMWAEGKLDVWINPNHSLRHLSYPPVNKPIPYIYYSRQEAESEGNIKQEKALNDKIPSGITSRYPLVFIQTGENLGFAGGNNVGIRYALVRDDFEYIWLLNNDTVISEDSLSGMVKVFEIENSVGMVGSKLLRYHNPNLLQTLCGTKKITWLNAGIGRYINPKREDRVEYDKFFEIEGYIVGASLLIKKDVIKDIGLFDEAFFMWAEEVDLCMRGTKSGWKPYCCGKSKVWHKEGSSTGDDKSKKFLWRKSNRPTLKRFVITGYLDIRNHIFIVRKHWGNYYMWIYVLGPSMIRLARRIIGILVYDDNKKIRISLLLKGLLDGIKGDLGKPKELI